jgi:putative ABC transport system permease protein
MAVSLIRGESANDLRTLTASGAAGRTRRTLTATTAGTLALLGVTLGTGGAYLALLAGYHAELGRLTPLPVTHLLLLGAGLPIAATVSGWLLGGREPRVFTRQALD